MTSCYNGLGKIELINNICKGTLSITHYPFGWEADSYGPGTALSLDLIVMPLRAGTLIELTEKALEYLGIERKKTERLYK